MRLPALHFRLALNHDRLLRAQDGVREAERKRDDAARLVRPRRRPHHVRVRAQQEGDLTRRGLVRERLRGDLLLWR